MNSPLLTCVVIPLLGALVVHGSFIFNDVLFQEPAQKPGKITQDGGKHSETNKKTGYRLQKDTTYDYGEEHYDREKKKDDERRNWQDTMSKKKRYPHRKSEGKFKRKKNYKNYKNGYHGVWYAKKST